MIDPDLLQRALVSRIHELESRLNGTRADIESVHEIVFPSVEHDPTDTSLMAARMRAELQRLGVGKSRANGDPDAR